YLKRSSASEASTMSQAAIRKLVADSIAVALEAQTATMAEADYSIREIPVEKRENYKEFISYQPFYFNAYGSFIDGLPRSIEGNVTALNPQNLEKAINIAQRNRSSSSRDSHPISRRRRSPMSSRRSPGLSSYIESLSRHPLYRRPSPTRNRPSCSRRPPYLRPIYPRNRSSSSRDSHPISRRRRSPMSSRRSPGLSSYIESLSRHPLYRRPSPTRNRPSCSRRPPYLRPIYP
nr:hypothetical protein [Tanacetum cinerariifolium]